MITENFIYSIPTEIYFGKGQIVSTGRIVSGYGRKALLVYGGGSIKRNGIYDDVIKIFKENGIARCELSGVEPNPRITMVREGVKLCCEEGVEVVVPIDGGSTIDCAKMVAGAVSYDGDVWDIILDPAKVVSVLPIVTVLTLSATGSETDTFAAISNLETNDKIGMEHEDMRPKTSILDPSYTRSIFVYQTAVGTADIMSHIFECYFSNVQGYMQDRMAEGLLKTCIEFGIRAVQNPEDYGARVNLMWTDSWAINNLIKLGKTMEWTVHPMEYQLSAYYNVTHGVGLVILMPHWMEYVLNEETADKFKDYGINVWGIDREKNPFEITYEAIRKTKDYFVAMGIPIAMREVGIKDETNFDVVAEKAAADLRGAYIELMKEDIKSVYRTTLQVFYKDVKDAFINNIEKACNT